MMEVLFCFLKGSPHDAEPICWIEHAAAWPGILREFFAFSQPAEG